MLVLEGHLTGQVVGSSETILFANTCLVQEGQLGANTQCQCGRLRAVEHMKQQLVHSNNLTQMHPKNITLPEPLKVQSANDLNGNTA